MYSYFPGNYVWNLSVMIALESGGRIGEIEEMCAPLKEAASRGEDPGTEEFLASWVTMADRLVALAEDDEALGRRLSAGEKLQRAALYYQVAERMQANGSPGRVAVYERSQQAFTRAVGHGWAPLERVEIPYLGATIPGWYRRPDPAALPPDGGPWPTMVLLNGLDSTKEMLVWTGLGEELARRGVASLCIDQPGTGEALRRHGLTATYDAERWASVVYDHTSALPGVDPSRIGLFGISLGGYYAPRAVAREPRYALGAVWGANHNWGEVQLRRLEREGERPVPHYWEHVRWVWGADDLDAFLALAPDINLDGVLDGVRVPFLVTHGANDQQIDVTYAHRTYDQLVNSPKRELRIFDERTGGVEHVSADNMSFGRTFIADWIAETMTELAESAADPSTVTEVAAGVAEGPGLAAGADGAAARPVRRIVTGHDEAGTSIVAVDGPVARVYSGLGEEGLVFHEVWHTAPTPAPIDRCSLEADEPSLTLAPPAAGTRIRVLDVPPDDPSADRDAVFEAVGGADAHLESDRHPSYHRTETIDYGIVLEGEIVLLLDDGEVTASAGDIVIQRGTAHGWVNRTDRSCRIAFVLIDGELEPGLA